MSLYINNVEYVLVTAARNEDKYICQTLDSVVSQRKKPKAWIIVSDCSTDSTDYIVRSYMKMNNFITLYTFSGDENRNFGSQVRAINKGLECLKGMDYQFIGNLDADISFGSRYFIELLTKFTENKRLGIGGGYICEEKKGVYAPRIANNTRSVPHAVQLFRRECFEEIGGYVPLKYGGPDWLAEIMARMRGWEVESFPELEVHHLRPTSGMEGRLRGAFRAGKMDHSMGSHPLFEIMKCIRRINSKPFLINSMVRTIGYLSGYINKEPRIVSEDIERYLRKEQIDRVKRSLYF